MSGQNACRPPLAGGAVPALFQESRIMPEITISPSDYINRIGRQAREASRTMARVSTSAKNAVLERIAELLLEQETNIRAANLTNNLRII